MGKVQRRLLSENSKETSRRLTAPDTSLNGPLLQLWRRFLKNENLSIDDDFFESGGDSLLAMDLHPELERLAGQTLPEQILFEASTVRQLANRLSRPMRVEPESDIQIASGGSQPPLLFFDGDNTGDGFFIKDLVRNLGPEHPLIAI